MLDTNLYSTSREATMFLIKRLFALENAVSAKPADGEAAAVQRLCEVYHLNLMELM